MSQQIAEVIFPDGAERRLVLANGEAARKFDIGSNWSKLRLGWRWAFSNAGIGITKDVDCVYVGLLANPQKSGSTLTNGCLGTTTGNFIGCRWTPMATNYTAGPPPQYIFTAPNCVRVGNTDTTSGGSSWPIWAAPDTYRMANILEFTRVSPTQISIQGVYPYSSGVSNCYDLPENILEAALEAATMIAARDTINNYLGTTRVNVTATYTMNVDEAANGAFDSCYIGWMRSLMNLYVSEMLRNKIA